MGIQNVSPEPPQTVRATEQVGVPGIDIFDGYVRADPETQLTGQLGVSQFDLMRREDPTIAAALSALTLPIRRASYEWRGGSQETLDFVSSCFGDMEGSFDDLISEACTMFPFGWAYFAWNLKKRQGRQRVPRPSSKYADGRLGFEQIALRAQSSLVRWQVSEKGKILGMWQLTDSMNGEEFLPISQGLLFRTTREANNPEGFSLLRPCWRSWRYKREIERIEAVGLQRALMGTPVVTLQPGGSNYATAGSQSDEYRARQMIADLHGNRTLGVVEDSFIKFRFETPRMQGLTGDSANVLKRKDEDLARALLAMFIMLGSQEQGSWALSRELADMFFLSVEGYLGSIVEVINREAVPVLLEWNGLSSQGEAPYLHATVNRRIDLETVCKVVNDLSGSKVLTVDLETERYIRKLIGLPDSVTARGETEEEEEDPEGPDEAEEESYAAGGERERRYRALEARYKQRLDQSVIEWSQSATEDLQAIQTEDLSPGQVMVVWSRSVEGLDLVKKVGWEYLPRAVELGYRSGALPKRVRDRVSQEISENDGYVDNRLKPITVSRMDPETAALVVALLSAGRDDEVEELVGGLTAVVRRHAALYAGQLWHAIMVGGSERAVEEGWAPVRWVNDPLARHCTECPVYAREYEDMEQLLAMTGGTLPGQGTECDGGCRCHIEYRDPSGWTWI